MQKFQAFFIVLFSLVLFACGESSEGITSEIISTGSDTSSSSAVFSFEGSDPSTISISGSTGEGTSETSTISFKLVDLYGDPIEGEDVEFTLTDFPIGTELLISSATTDESGIVSAVVKSGMVEGPVTVKVASFSDATLYKNSNSLSVTNGYPDQDSFSLSADNYAPEGYDYDGEEVTVTVRLGGGEGNTAVPDGTVVNFRTTAGGIITDDTGTVSTCSTIGSNCEMTWSSQGERPENGRVLITAYSTGEESFIDSNRDGLYTASEPFTDNPEAFADEDSNGEQNDDEWYDDADSSGDWTGGDEVYTGLHCPEDSGACIRDSVTIFGSIQLVSAGSDLSCDFYSDEDLTTDLVSVDLSSKTSATFYVKTTDQNGNTPPSSTGISAVTSNGTISGDSSWTVTNTNDYYYSFAITLVADDEASSDSLTLTLTTPAEDSSTCSITVED